jgi:hypothetical protein
MTIRRQLSANNASTVLASDIARTDLTISLVDGSRFPYPTTNQFFLVTLDNGVDVEVVEVTSRSGNTLSGISRAQEGTSASYFAAGTRVEVRVTSGYLSTLENLKQTVADLTAGTASLTGVDRLVFSDVPGAPTPRGMTWNQSELTVDLQLDGTGVTLQLGQEMLYRVRNSTASTLPNGTVVMAAGTLGNSGRILVAPAIANGTYESKYIMGVVTEDIAAGADGFVTHFGKVRGIPTSGASVGESWADGDILYAHPTNPGKLTKLKPSVPNEIVTVAIVLSANPSNGTLVVRPTIDSHSSGVAKFLPAGTGAVATSVQNKLRDIAVSVKDYGAVGDGSTDDTAAISLAISYAASSGKLLVAPAGRYLLSGSGLSLPAGFPGLIGEGLLRTLFYYTGTGTALTIDGSSKLGVYRDWQVVAGVVGATESEARSSTRNGIYWNCYGGGGSIKNVKATYFNGFGMKFEAITDSYVENIITEACGNSSEKALSVINGTASSKNNVFNRVQVDGSYVMALHFDGAQNLLTALRSERTTGNGVVYSHIISGDVSLVDGLIDGPTYVYTSIGVGSGFVKNLTVKSGATDFVTSSGSDLTSIESSTFYGNASVATGSSRPYLFKSCKFLGNFTSSYIGSSYTELVNCSIALDVYCSGNNVKVRLRDCYTSGQITSGIGSNTVVINGGDYANYPNNDNVLAMNANFANAFSTGFTQKSTAINCTFSGLATIRGTTTRWVSESCDYNGGVALGTGTPGWAFGLNDTFASVTGALSAAPTVGTWQRGQRAYNPTPTVGQPKSWVCTASGTPGTWVSEGNL